VWVVFVHVLLKNNPKDRIPEAIEPGIKGAPILESFLFIRFFEFVHDMYTM
jgi:hypothetical protein